MSAKVNLFLSWSGDSSRQIAEILKEWLFTVSSELDIFFTPDGIEAGRRWSSELAQKLQDCEIGIFVYTRQNLDSLWMAFEAGALSKSIETGRVIPLIFGEPELKLKQPLAQFQAKRFSQKGILETLEAVNNCLSNKKTKEEIKAFLDFTWSTLDTKVTQVLEKELNSDKEPGDRDVSEILNNLYTLIRTSPVYRPDFAKDISELLEQVKTTNRGSYLFIDGEKPAFAALIAATKRAKKYIRSTRFSPMPISGNQDDYGAAICDRVVPKRSSNNCVERYTRVIAANDEEKLRDIDGYLDQFLRCTPLSRQKTTQFKIVPAQVTS
jgi:hypothetical protein